MEAYYAIMGVDVSKLTLDIICASRGLHLKIDIDNKGFVEFKRLCKANEINLKETLIINGAYLWL